MMKHIRKLNLLLWKNYLIQKRTPVRTLTEFLMPLIMSAVLVILRLIVSREEVKNPIAFSSFEMSDCVLNNPVLRKTWIIGWSPGNSTVAQRIIDNIRLPVNMEKEYNFQPYSNETELEKRMMDDGSNKTKSVMLAGIVFDATNLTEEFPKDLKIKIRFPGISRIPDINSTTLDTQAPNWRTHIVFPLYQPFGPRDSHSRIGGQPGYCEEGFLPLQIALYGASVEYYNENSTIPDFEFQRFAYPPYTKDQYLPALILFVSIFIIIMYTYSSVSTIKMVAVEKETQMKSAMKIMGLPNWMHWTAWITKEFVQWLLPSIFITVLLTYEWAGRGCVLKHTNPFVLLTILVVFSFSSIMFCFLVSVCFNRANSAAAVGSALWFVSYAPYMVMQPHYAVMSLWEIKIWSLISNTNIGYIFQFLVNYEGAGVGLQWSNLFVPNSPTDKITAGELLVTLVFDAVLYFCLTIYIETAFPGQYGIAKPWYFPLQITYWCGYDNRYKEINVAKKGIQLKNLTKVYSNGKLAVNCLQMEMLEDQITILLGHNGAGKSSTMSMLSGLIKPTSGTAYINGFNIWSDMSKIRDCLGLCPQYNLLFPELTIKEHLIFFGMLKGRFGKELIDEINGYVKMLEMETKLNCLAGCLSGGYQRKLSVAIALIGKSKIVLMDEPTAGMDPNARRRLWDLLQIEREGRTIVMTTHLLDEADLLGDRVAILSRGKLKCIGTPLNLKTDPDGYRYTLNLVKETDRASTDTERVTEFLTKFCKTVRLQVDSRTELKYKIVDSKELPELLTTLNKEKHKYGILDFGISLISLEDVYLRITNDDDDTYKEEKPSETDNATKKDGMSTNSTRNKTRSEIKPGTYYSFSKKGNMKYQRWRQQFKAMLLKKMLVSRRTWLMHFIQVLITIVFLIIATIVTHSWRGSSDLAPLEFSLQVFRNPIILIEEKENRQFDENKHQRFVSLLKPIVEKQGGIVEYVDPRRKHSAANNSRIDDFILKKYDDLGIEVVNERYLAALEYDDITNVAKIHFNNQPYHTVPTTLNIVQNVTFKMLTNENNSISFINAPFPYLPEEKILKLEGGSNLGFQVGFNTGFAQAFVAGVFLLSILKEKVTGSQHLQYVSGVSATAYWSASVVWDFLMYLIPLTVQALVLYLFQDEAFSQPEQLAQVIILLIFYDWAMIPVIHIISFVFSSPSLGFMIVSILGVVTGCSLYLIHLVLEIRPLRMVDEANTMEAVTIWFPHYSLCSGLRNIYANFDFRIGDADYKGDYSWDKPGIGKNLVVLFVTGLSFNVALLSLNYVHDKAQKMISIVKKYWSHLKRTSGNSADQELTLVTTVSSLYEDHDIIQEKSVVENSAKVDYCVLIKNVSKCYGKTVAVRSMNLALSAHECFVLLGTNGAGKTTTFKMLTTHENVTSGSISICSMDIVREKKQVLQLIGYCPQQDGLVDKLTGRETLRMFCILRGVDPVDHQVVISQLSTRLQFRHVLDVPVANYSGGMKRKLSAAVAMIGDPPVLLLDEPTSGMDPDARAHLWSVIHEERARGKCVIITTHSLEECEALCTRLAIMVEGEIRCIGSVQYLKNKYASGHKLHVKFPIDELENVKLHISTHLPGSSIHEEFKGVIMFQIPTEIPCSQIFSVMEAAKKVSQIEDYSIQQTSLEQVFTQITKKTKS